MCWVLRAVEGSYHSYNDVKGSFANLERIMVRGGRGTRDLQVPELGHVEDLEDSIDRCLRLSDLTTAHSNGRPNTRETLPYQLTRKSARG
jgi:hypothetical protein